MKIINNQRIFIHQNWVKQERVEIEQLEQLASQNLSKYNIIVRYFKGQSKHKIAEDLQIDCKYVREVIVKFITHKSVEIDLRNLNKGRPSLFDNDHVSQIREMVDENNITGLKDIHQAIQQYQVVQKLMSVFQKVVYYVNKADYFQFFLPVFKKNDLDSPKSIIQKNQMQRKRQQFEVMEQVDIRLLLLNYYKSGYKAAQAAEEINKAWGDDTTTERTTYRWFNQFEQGDLSIKNKKGQDRKSSIDPVYLKELVEEEPRITIRELSYKTETSFKTVHNHLILLKKVKKLDKWVPHSLNTTQKKKIMEVAQNLLERNQTELILNRIITCDENWILYQNQRRSGQWLDKEESPKTMPKPALHPKKVMITVWWFNKGLIHQSILKYGETITSETYCKELDVMHQRLKEIYPALINRHGPILLHDNARPHSAKMTKEKLIQLGIQSLSHPAYSLNLVPSDYYLFKHLDRYLQGKNFKNFDEIENAFLEFIRSREPNFLLKVSQSLKRDGKSALMPTEIILIEYLYVMYLNLQN